MSGTESLRREVQRHQAAIARLQQTKAAEARKVADYAKRAADARLAASRATSMSSAQSKLRDAQRYTSEQVKATERVATLERSLAREHERLAAAQQRLARGEADAATKQQRSNERVMKEASQRASAIANGVGVLASRHGELEDRVTRLETLPERIVVLFLAANPLDESQLRLDEEVRAIAERIRQSKHRDAVKLESCWAVRPPDVLQAINEHRPRIVHFSGHGTEGDEIVFQDDAGQAKYVSKAAMVQLMSACSGNIKLVFFNTCFSQGQAEAVVGSVDAAIGMASSVDDEAARMFSAQFYSAIGFGLSVGRAFEQAKALIMMEGLGEEDVPRLFLRPGQSADQLILVAPAASSAE